MPELSDDLVDVTSTPLEDLHHTLEVAEPPGTWRKLPVPVRAVRMTHPFRIQTLEGLMTGGAGDYLIVGVQGERYPCRREIFEATYEPTPPTPPAPPAEPEGVTDAGDR
jgi:hypothetical protein